MTIEIFGRSIAPGSHQRFRAKVAEQNDSSEVTIPVLVTAGERPGPLLVLTGAVHGDEYAGWSVIRALLPQIAPDSLRGTLVALPVTNPLAFFVESPMNVLDYEHLNLNRIWPGNPAGFLSQQMASAIFSACLARATHIVDIHDGGRDLLARYLMVAGTPTVRTRVHDAAMQMAFWFGQGLPVRDMILDEAMLRMGRWGALYEAAGHINIPVLMVELGGGGHLWDDQIADGVRGVRNILIGLGMIDGQMEGIARSQLVIRQSHWIQPTRGGFAMNHVALGQIVEADTLLGEILDPFGDVVETFHSPYRSVLLDVRFASAVHPGDLLFHCGQVE